MNAASVLFAENANEGLEMSPLCGLGWWRGEGGGGRVMKKSVCVVGLFFTGASAFAGISQSTLVSPGGFVQAGADPGTSGGIAWPGLDLDAAINGADSSFAEGSFSGLATITRFAAASGGSVSNSAHGLVGMGYLIFEASNSAPNNSPFPFAMANGGWKETFTVSNPAHTGEAGFLQFGINAAAFLRATGLAGAAVVRVTAYKDNVQLMVNPFFSPGNSNVLSTDRQYGNWSVASVGTTVEESIHDDATFAVPITFGTPFTLGVYAWSVAGMRASGGNGEVSTALVDNSVVRWGGILNVIAGSTPVTGSTVTGSTGKDWGPGTIPPDPCPGDFNNDGVVDDADFVIFAAGYNLLLCEDPAMTDGCPADMNGDLLVDDADFSLFVVAYNELVCV